MSIAQLLREDEQYLGEGTYKAVKALDGNRVLKACFDPSQLGREVEDLREAARLGVPVALPIEVNREEGWFTQQRLLSVRDASWDALTAFSKAVAYLDAVIDDIRVDNMGYCPWTRRVLVHDLKLFPILEGEPPLLRQFAWREEGLVWEEYRTECGQRRLYRREVIGFYAAAAKEKAPDRALLVPSPKERLEAYTKGRAIGHAWYIIGQASYAQRAWAKARLAQQQDWSFQATIGLMLELSIRDNDVKDASCPANMLVKL